MPWKVKEFWFGLILVLAGTSAAALGLGWLVHLVAPVITKPENSNGLAGVTAFLGSLATLVLTKKWDASNVVQQELRKQKAAAYEKFFEFLLSLIKDPTPLKREDPEALKRINDVWKGLTVWASNDVIMRYGEFRIASLSDDQSVVFGAFGKLLLSMRTDLGHSGGLEEAAILSVFIKDLPTKAKVKAP